VKYRRIVHITLVRLLCPSMEKKDKISSAHNQIDAGNLLSNILTLTYHHVQPGQGGTWTEKGITILCIQAMFSERRSAFVYPTLMNSDINDLSPHQTGPRRYLDWNANLILKKQTSSHTFLYQVPFVANMEYNL